MKKITHTLILITLVVPLLGQSRIKVACIGASITQGYGLSDPSTESYPGQLQNIIGDRYIVTNYGVSGTTLLKKGDHPYWATHEYETALASVPDVVIIDLGGNDSKAINRVFSNDIADDLSNLAGSFQAQNPHSRIIVLLPIVSFITDSSQIWDPEIVKNITPKIRQVAFDKQLELVDMHSVLSDKPQLVPDRIHPDVTGASLMAKRLASIILASRDSDFNIFKSIPVEKMTDFYGYKCADFRYDGRDCKVVQPKKTASGHPWIWRARFWGHEPQTDVALLELGYHVAYCDVAELFGNAQAIRHWNKFYKLLISKGLNKKAAMEGMSRGAVYVYNWAAENPTKISSVYVDNPVLDLKSWPGSQQNKPEHKEWDTFKQDYGLKSDDEAGKFKGSPIDKVARLVKGRYPMLHVCGDADEDVPMSENTTLFEQKVNSLGGNITVIHKPGFKHHPHSLPDPDPIVQFILKASKK